MTARPRRRFRWLALAMFAFAGATLAMLRNSPDTPPSPLADTRPTRLVYRPTPQNEAALRAMIDGTLTFIVLHEAGHMMVSELGVPVLGHEEDAADGFALFVLAEQNPTQASTSQEHTAQEEAMASAAIFFDGLYQDELAHKDVPNWADVHGQPEQRAFTILCLLYGIDQPRFEDVARQAKLPASRMRQCPSEAAKNRADWIKALDPAIDQANANSAGPAQIGVHYRPVGQDIPEPLRSRLVRDSARIEASGALRKAAAVMRIVPARLETRLLRAKLRLTDDASLAQMTRIRIHGPTQPGDQAFLESFDDYRIVGDACIDASGQADQNAFWDQKTRTITLCYALVELVENVAKTTLATYDAL